RRRVSSGWVLVPLALLTWVLVNASGVHATVAGVALGLLTRVRTDPGEDRSPAERLEHTVRPLSAGVAVPVFALLSAGLPVGAAALGATLRDVAAAGVIAGLVVGKFLGVFGGTWMTARLTRAELSPDLEWGDVAGVALLAGIGFTVALLIGDLAFAGEGDRADHVKAAVLLASLASAALASLVVRWRDRHHRRRAAARAERPDTPL
ncbi:MAG TPA: Na+/H+ antiporter NhaA, partial [Candidatus Eisenbacteria bacterium]|nr:Na+/H+ antiporter NhaA [Candidatus Eisenbacteria bacterium]